MQYILVKDNVIEVNLYAGYYPRAATMKAAAINQ